MSFSKILINTPILREGITWKRINNTIYISYRDQGCILESIDNLDIASKLMHKLELGCDVKSLNTIELGLIDNLDKLGLIEQSIQKKEQPLFDGVSAFHEVMHFINNHQLSNSHSVFFNLMKEDKISKNQLIGYIMEYLHITRMAHKILSASIIHQDDRIIEDTLLKFFNKELFHDRLIEQSLSSVGYSKNDLKYLNALPSTFGICTTLFSISSQHFLSFQIALFLFEKEFNDFDNEFKRNAERLNLPKKFVEPILKHTHINNEGSHDEISIDLLKNVKVVSNSDLIFVKQNLLKLSQLLSWQDIEITEYYSNSQNGFPRV
jgi:pyrroloquinoline quinone (PQQ) biosynthesis protein C